MVFGTVPARERGGIGFGIGGFARQEADAARPASRMNPNLAEPPSFVAGRSEPLSGTQGEQLR